MSAATLKNSQSRRDGRSLPWAPAHGYGTHRSLESRRDDRPERCPLSPLPGLATQTTHSLRGFTPPAPRCRRMRGFERRSNRAGVPLGVWGAPGKRPGGQQLRIELRPVLGINSRFRNLAWGSIHRPKTCKLRYLPHSKCTDPVRSRPRSLFFAPPLTPFAPGGIAGKAQAGSERIVDDPLG